MAQVTRANEVALVPKVPLLMTETTIERVSAFGSLETPAIVQFGSRSKLIPGFD